MKILALKIFVLFIAGFIAGILYSKYFESNIKVIKSLTLSLQKKELQLDSLRIITDQYLHIKKIKPIVLTHYNNTDHLFGKEVVLCLNNTTGYKFVMQIGSLNLENYSLYDTTFTMISDTSEIFNSFKLPESKNNKPIEGFVYVYYSDTLAGLFPFSELKEQH